MVRGNKRNLFLKFKRDSQMSKQMSKEMHKQISDTRVDCRFLTAVSVAAVAISLASTSALAGGPKANLTKRSLDANYVEIVINPSVVNLDWSTPKKLARSYFGSLVRQKYADLFRDVSKSTVGHAVVHLNCTTSSGSVVSTYTGMSGEENRDNSLDEIVNKQTGLKMLFDNFDDGYLETDDEARNLIAHHSARTDVDARGVVSIKNPKFLRYRISPEQCDRAVDVFETFKNVSYEQASEQLDRLPMSEKLYFGLTLDAYEMYLARKQNPKSMLGGVCTSFGVAVLKAAGVYDPFFETIWRRPVAVSIDKMGGKNTRTGQSYKFPLGQLLKGKQGDSWITKGVPVKRLSYYEPEKIWNFIDGVNDCTAYLRKTKSRKDLSANCNKAIMSWMRRQGLQLNGHAHQTVTGDFERIESEPGEDNDRTQTIEYTEDVQIDGIELTLQQ